MDQVAATIGAIFPNLKILLKPSKLVQVTPENTDSYIKAKERVRKIIYKKWVDWDYLPDYNYRPLFQDCCSFMTLAKFQAGWIHQMRAHKSYLNVHKDWSNQGREVISGKCETEPETLEHVVKCLVVAGDRREYLLRISE